MYNISQIKLISARIPLPQLTVDSFNSNVTYDNTLIQLNQRDYLTGNALASNIQSQFGTDLGVGTCNVTYNTTTRALEFSNTSQFSMTFGDNSPAQVWGFLPSNTLVKNTTHVGGCVDLTGPTALILSINGDERDDIKNDLYLSGTAEKPMHYFGRIITVSYTDKRLIDYNGSSDPVRHNFYRGNESYIESFRFKFYCNNFHEVHPYQFRLRNHILKFQITCTLDKLILNRESAKNEKMISLPPALDIDRFRDHYRVLGDRKVMVYGGSAVVIVLIVLILSSLKTPTV